MKKNYGFIITLVVILIQAAGCGGGGGRLVKNAQIHPRLESSPSLSKHKTSLTVVLSHRIKSEQKVIRGQGHIKLVITNFKKAAGKTIANAFKENFTSVSVTGQESMRGLELIIQSLVIGTDQDSLTYHVALKENGKLIYEKRNKIVQPLKRVTATVYTWKEVVARLTLDYVEKNVAQMGDELNNDLLINPSLRRFWSKYRR